MGSTETYEALKFVLIKKVYPLNPQMVRHDTRCASIVHSYLKEIDSKTEDWVRRMRDLSYLERQLLETRHMVEPLLGLSEDTLRKYISELWRRGAFDGFLKFDNVNDL